jgi:hypothetical protein
MMTNIETIRTRIRDLTEQARRAIRLHDARAIGSMECLRLADQVRQFMVQVTTDALDLADRAEAIGDRQRAEELFGLAMEIERGLLGDRGDL